MKIRIVRRIRILREGSEEQKERSGKAGCNAPIYVKMVVLAHRRFAVGTAFTCSGDICAKHSRGHCTVKPIVCLGYAQVQSAELDA